MQRFSLTQYRARVARMGVRELHGNLVHFKANRKAGTITPEFATALLEGDAARGAELREYIVGTARGPTLAWEENAEARRAEVDALKDAVVELQATGKGGVQRYLIPRANVEAASQRADDLVVAA